jgi:hypothetical protein
MVTLRWAAPTCSPGTVSTQAMASGLVPNSAASSQAGFQVQDCSSTVGYVMLIAAAGVAYMTHMFVTKGKG